MSYRGITATEGLSVDICLLGLRSRVYVDRTSHVRLYPIFLRSDRPQCESSYVSL
jgi:hypothetical protein